MATVLIASLGESPAVVTAMYNLLTQDKQLVIDKVIVLRPKDGVRLIDFGYEIIKEALEGKCEVVPEYLLKTDNSQPTDLEDVNDEESCLAFLQQFSMLLTNCQHNDDTVYLSLAGGRKNVSALMALIVPLFPCVKKLYHVIDKDETNFPTIEELLDLQENKRLSHLFPKLSWLKLVDIPYGKHQHVSEAFRSRLYTLAESDLEALWASNDYEAEATAFGQMIVSGTSSHFLEVILTEHAAGQFRDMWQKDRLSARGFEICFARMRYPTLLRGLLHATLTRKLRKGEHDLYSQGLSSLTFRFLKRGGERQTRPVFHTLPKDIKYCKDEEVERVIVSELEIEVGNKYRSLESIVSSFTFPLGPFIPAQELLTELHKSEPDPENKSILLVPLGITPMIATQLYALFTSQGQNIKEVILIYPSGLPEVRISAYIAQQAFADKNVPCKSIEIRDLEDLDTTEACELYERKLEETVDDLRQQHPECQIELALSGGRKGMAALAMFVAQRKGIHYVYHTLITDEKLDKQITEATKVSTLNKVSTQERNNRLFLDAYGGSDSGRFVLFKVPVLPITKS